MNIDDIRRKNLVRLFETTDISKSDLARRIGKTPQYINGIINEGKNFSDEMAGVFAEGFGVDKSEFYRGLDTSGSFESIVNPPTIEIKEEDIRTKLITLIGDILLNGNPDQINGLCKIAESINLEINEQKKAYPMINTPVSEEKKVA